jgi:transcriptional regulator with XRE-family HTH domain
MSGSDRDEGQRRRRARFASNVERLRRRAGISLDDLAGRSQVDREELDALLRGDLEARVDTIYLLAGALEVDPEGLFDGVTWVPGEGYRVDD